MSARSFTSCAQAAALYASGALGAAWPVFPVGPDKHPHPCLPPMPEGEGGFKLATCDLEQIEAWWAAHPEAGIGVDLGRAGLAVVDLEGVAKGFDPVAVLDQILAAVPLPITLAATTPSQGWHFFYAIGHGRQARTRIAGVDGVPIVGVEVRRAGHYVVLPPGPGREWFTWGPPEPAPDWLIAPPPAPRPRSPARRFDWTRDGTRKGLGALRAAAERMRCAPEGHRHPTLASMAPWLFELAAAGELDARAAFEELERAARAAGLEREEVEPVLAWAMDRCLGRGEEAAS